MGFFQRSSGLKANFRNRTVSKMQLYATLQGGVYATLLYYWRKCSATIDIGKAKVELFKFPEQGALMHAQLSGCGQPIITITLQGLPYRLLFRRPTDGMH